MSSWLGLMIPVAGITQWWEQVANMELAEWGGALRGSCGGSSLLTRSLGRQSCELIPRSPTDIAILSGRSPRPLHLPPKGLLSRLPQRWQSSTAHRSLLQPLLAKDYPPSSTKPEPELAFFTARLTFIILSTGSSLRSLFLLCGTHSLSLTLICPQLTTGFLLGYSTPLHLTRVSSMSEAHSGQAGILAKR